MYPLKQNSDKSGAQSEKAHTSGGAVELLCGTEGTRARPHVRAHSFVLAARRAHLCVDTPPSAARKAASRKRAGWDRSEKGRLIPHQLDALHTCMSVVAPHVCANDDQQEGGSKINCGFVTRRPERPLELKDTYRRR